jgi:excisionase family DNA binding protein
VARGRAARARVEAGGVTGRLCNANVIARLLNVPETWVREQTRSGAMPHVRLGRYVRYDVDDVRAWLESCKTPGRSVAFRTTNPRR